MPFATLVAVHPHSCSLRTSPAMSLTYSHYTFSHIHLSRPFSAFSYRLALFRIVILAPSLAASHIVWGCSAISRSFLYSLMPPRTV
ncbi:hypothetical protein F4604DRAFT_1933742 [Suillus subluteus]|nr:hypothetical protein F4604DRAFT_1933742 [Suillus subluteus]